MKQYEYKIVDLLEGMDQTLVDAALGASEDPEDGAYQDVLTAEADVDEDADLQEGRYNSAGEAEAILRMKAQEKLNELGHEGWQLVGLVMFWAYFMRQSGQKK